MTAAAATRPSLRRAWPWLLLGLVVVVLDQLTKAIVVEQLLYREEVPVTAFFSWVYLCNPGAAFSFLSDAGGWQRWLFVALALGFSGFILLELRRLPEGERLQGVVFGLILGGALGNGVDRLLNGCVVDFLSFHYGSSYFPAFNLADSALFCGAVLWIGLMIRDYRREQADD